MCKVNVVVIKFSEFETENLMFELRPEKLTFESKSGNCFSIHS
jgi:hypothetical protein